MNNILILMMIGAGVFIIMGLIDFFLYALMRYSGGYKPKKSIAPMSIWEYFTKYSEWKKSKDHDYPSL